MRFYVASRFGNYRKVREVTDRLVEAGHTITYDWTRAVGEFDEDGKLLVDPAADLSPEQQLHFAHEDTNGAMLCNALILLWTPDMAGAYIEVGMALTVGTIDVHVVGCPRFTIFWALPQVRHHNTLEDLYKCLGI